MTFYLELHKAKDIQREEDGTPWAWEGGETVATFTNPNLFKMYVHKNIKKLKSVVAFTGSASLLLSANGFITDELKKAGLL